MESIAYYDGKIGAPEELMVPFNDRVHFFGDGCYDATVGANGKVYLLQDHLDRFFTSAKALDINIPMSKAELGRLLTDLLAKVDPTVHIPADTQLVAADAKGAGVPMLDLVKEGRAAGTFLIWVAFFCCLLMVYALGSWLPKAQATVWVRACRSCWR
jgi:branched-subunit amino acid aminotransferase/4-amino-4-deoxychorismate lyase